MIPYLSLDSQAFFYDRISPMRDTIQVRTSEVGDGPPAQLSQPIRSSWRLSGRAAARTTKAMLAMFMLVVMGTKVTKRNTEEPGFYEGLAFLYVQ
jgi:hypothetical protein